MWPDNLQQPECSSLHRSGVLVTQLHSCFIERKRSRDLAFLQVSKLGPQICWSEGVRVPLASLAGHWPPLPNRFKGSIPRQGYMMQDVGHVSQPPITLGPVLHDIAKQMVVTPSPLPREKTTPCLRKQSESVYMSCISPHAEAGTVTPWPRNGWTHLQFSLQVVTTPGIPLTLWRRKCKVSLVQNRFMGSFSACLESEWWPRVQPSPCLWHSMRV